MELKFLLIFASLSVILVVSHAALPSVVYWNSQLPGSPMPKVVKDLLKNGHEGKPVYVGESEGPNPIFLYHHAGVSEGPNPIFLYHDASASEGPNPIFLYHHAGVSEDLNPIFLYHHAGVSEDPNPIFLYHHDGVSEDPNPIFLYHHAASETQLHDNPNVALFFLEKDLHQGKSLDLEFVKTENPENLLPRKVADSIPFSSKYTPEIFEKLSVKPESKEARIIKKTILECEESGIKGEEKYCATSLESMIDFSVSKLGKNIQAISTDAHEQTQKQKYTILLAKKINKDDEAVVCHKQNYPYAVFYCHKSGKTEAFSVTLVGENGGKIEAVAVCHKDTSAWNAKHLAFQVLNMKPGTDPVCHFLLENHIVWVPK